MLEAAARVAKNTDAEDRAYQIRWRAANKVGELSKKIEKGHGNRYTRNPDAPDLKNNVLERVGLSTQDASDFERLSDVPRDQFETALATKSVHDATATRISSRSYAVWRCAAQGNRRGSSAYRATASREARDSREVRDEPERAMDANADWYVIEKP